MKNLKISGLFSLFLADNGKNSYFCSIITIKLADNGMEYISVREFAEVHGVSERTVRNYCATGRIEGAALVGKTWSIPSDAVLPCRKSRPCASPLLKMLREQKERRMMGGIYHRVQIDLTYNSNHIEGSRLTHDQTRFIFETNTIGVTADAVNVDDIIETANHFRCVDHIIDEAVATLTEAFVKNLHRMLKAGTTDERLPWFRVGDYKRLPNEVGGHDTCPPEDVHRRMKALLADYNESRRHTIEEIIDFHQRFETIHPFQDGNGRVGRLIMFKECLANDVVPFIITDRLKMFYYRGLREWPGIKGFLLDTCLAAQDEFKDILDYFRIK